MGLNECMKCGISTVYEKLCDDCSKDLKKCANCANNPFYDRKWVLCKMCLIKRFGECRKCDNPAIGADHINCICHTDLTRVD